MGVSGLLVDFVFFDLDMDHQYSKSVQALHGPNLLLWNKFLLQEEEEAEAADSKLLKETAVEETFLEHGEFGGG